MKLFRYGLNLLKAAIIIFAAACQKTGTAPSDHGVAALTVVNALPTSSPIIPVINTSTPIMYFKNARNIRYGNYFEYSPLGANDTIYVVQRNSDTLNVGPKASGQMFYGILPLKIGGIYSLFLCGSDIKSPDYLFTTDTLPYHGPSDSTIGIRFVNLSTGSSPISINLEGSPNGSEISSLSYKGITGFRNYFSNAATSVNGYQFVIRDAATGDSLSSISLTSDNGVPGLTDPSNSNQITFENVTIALIGQPGATAVVPQQAVLIDNY